jgi:hypothetical protein
MPLCSLAYCLAAAFKNAGKSVASLSPNAKLLMQMVGVIGFEPTTPSSRTRCATRLRYTPTPTLHREGRSYSREGRGLQGEILAILKIYLKLGLSQNRVARDGSADYVHAHIGASPSGKAAVFGTAIPRFESWRPSHPLVGLNTRLIPPTASRIALRDGCLWHS